MSVLVVIPCLNEAAHLERLLAQFLSDSEVERIVVADGGSDDGSQAIVETYTQRDGRVHLLHNEARIQSAGVNLAVARFGEGMKWLLRVDAHCIYPDNYAQTLLASARERKAGAVVVPMLTVGRKGFQLAVAAAQNSALGTGGSAHRSVTQGAFVDHGHHALIRLDVFQRVGGYCESMVCNEDAELDYRLTQAGERIWLEPKARITYLPRETVASLARQYFKYGKGRADNVKRHRLRPRLRQLVPLTVPLAIAALPLALLHPIFALPLMGWLALCLLGGAIIGWRSDTGKWALLAGVAAAVMHAAWAAGFLKKYVFSKRPDEPRYGLLESS